jgi:hypothetical protein
MTNREIDKSIAKLVEYVQLTTAWNPIDKIYGELPHYSTNMSDAWKVVEYLRERDLFIDIITARDGYRIEVIHSGRGVVHVEQGESVPKAICIATLKAVGNDD